LFEPLTTFFDLLGAGQESPQLLPALDVLPLQSVSPHGEILEQRAIGLWRLATRRVPVTVVPAASVLLRLEAPEYYRQLALHLRVGDEVPLDEIVAHLESIGYERREPVEMVGEYSVRGGILDVFSPEAAKPVRIDLFGDLLESIRRFDVESQRSVLKLEETTLLPLTEYQKSRQLLLELLHCLEEAGAPQRDLPPPGEPFPGWELLVPMVRTRQNSVFDLLDRPLVLWNEPEQVKGAAERLWKRLEQTETSPAYDPARIYFHWKELERQASAFPQIGLREVEVVTGSDVPGFYIPSRPSLTFHGNMQVAIAEARNLADSGSRVAFFAESNGELERLADIFNEYGVPYQLGLEQSDSTPEYLAERAYMAGSVASIYLIRGAIRRGAVFRDAALAVFGSEDLFETSELVARAPAGKSALATFSPDLIDLKPGDYVVHAEHGVAQYLGLREIDHGEARGDYMLLEYAGGAKLYVPLTRMDLVQRFRGAGEAAPPLDRMGGATWTRTKSRVKAKMRDM